jgi:hypothetical protein
MTRRHVTEMVGLAGLVWACLLAGPARGDEREVDRPVITSVTVDLASERLTMRGRAFGRGPRVGLALTELEVGGGPSTARPATRRATSSRIKDRA